jgi:hypothetical protein
MIYDTGEYDIQLEIPTDNFALAHLYPSHLQPALKHNKQLVMQQRPDLKFTHILQKTLDEH